MKSSRTHLYGVITAYAVVDEPSMGDDHSSYSIIRTQSENKALFFIIIIGVYG